MLELLRDVYKVTRDDVDAMIAGDDMTPDAVVVLPRVFRV
jgi:hypothetical protein